MLSTSDAPVINIFLFSTVIFLTFLSFLSLPTFKIVFQGQMRCTGPGEEEGILPGQCFFPSFYLDFFPLGFHTLSSDPPLGSIRKSTSLIKILCLYVNT